MVATSEDTYLLGKFQVVAVPAVADYDAGFNSLQAWLMGWNRDAPRTTAKRAPVDIRTWAQPKTLRI